MTTQLLATELANLIQESKRKHNDLRQAAEKSLEELRNLRNTSEQGAPEELSQKVHFVNPFIIACGTKNAKFTAIAIVCLQRLIVARALPRSRLNQVLQALTQASSAGLDVQLKILQALPSLLQNYSADLKGDLLVNALNICFTLQNSKNAIVNNTSAATLQQLVVSVFDKVIAEDKSGTESVAGVAPTSDGEVELRAAALDAYRIFNDLCLLTENQRPEFLRFSGLPQTFGLELIESVITNHSSVFTNHPEQVHVLRVRAMPLVVSALKGRPSFATAVRLVRILYTMVRKHINLLPNECGEALEILTQLLDHDSALWKRALCMEVFRGVFAEHALLRRIFALYDAKEGEKDILKTLTATFVRLSTEKPSVIGLGHQSSMPISSSQAPLNIAQDQAMLEASGVAGIINSTGAEATNTGVSAQWSTIRVPCIDQLDKTEPPTIPESYTYSLILTCISSLSDGLAKFILPLTVATEGRSRRKVSKNESGPDSPTPESEGQPTKEKMDRPSALKKNPIPVNPLAMEDHPMFTEVKTCAEIVDECWPAILATCSTFLYAALDSEYYHGLVRAFQRFAHVAGMLQLSTPRDAFLTTLGKAAVPPNVFTACLNAGQYRPATPNSAVEGPASLLNNARGLLSTENLTNQAEKPRQTSFDTQPATLSTRNLLCLRALLNLGIALGPTLGPAWRIILETLQQADFVLFSSSKAPSRSPSFPRGQDQAGDNDATSLTANFGNEVRAVETAAARLMESTVDFPNESFLDVASAICQLLERKSVDKGDVGSQQQTPTTEKPQSLQTPGGQHRRVSSFSNQASTGSVQEDQFALAKLGDVASINMERLLTYPPEESGWALLTDKLVNVSDTLLNGSTVRTRAAEILTRFMLEAANMASSFPPKARGPIQLRMLGALNAALEPLQEEDRQVSVATHATDVEIHRIILDGLKGIVEECGENLISGWEIAFDIIGSVFIMKDGGPGDRPRAATDPTIIETRSSKLVRASFNSLQLVASDFLASLPNSCFLILVDTLYKFSSQDDDLNIALTTVTFFWILSDFLSGKDESLDITAELMQETEASDLTKKAADRSHKGSVPALWMLLLLRLTTVASDDRLELRNSAIQTLLRIFDAYGDRLSPEAWSICIKSVVFKLLTALEEELKAAQGEGADESDRNDWNGTAVVVLNGISNLLANYIDVLTQHASFNQLWRDLLLHLMTLLDFGVLDINTAAFKSLAHILSQTSHEGGPTFKKETVEPAWELWSRGVPVSTSKANGADNQACLIAYVGALREVYRLIEADLNVDRVRKILKLLRKTVEEASVGSYTSDVEQATQLQAHVLSAIHMLRTNVEGVPSAIIKQISEFIILAFEQGDASPRPNPKRTFVAMSKASMQAVEGLILKHATDKDIYISGAFSSALAALCKPVALKYGFDIVTRSTQPWRLATTTALAILKPALSQLGKLEVPTKTSQRVWTTIVAIADGIVGADCESAPANTPFGDDEAFDISSFRALRELIIPPLGAENVQDKARKSYAESLFKTSIIHAPSPADESIISGTQGGGLSALYTPRAGRTVTVPPTKRTQMAYVVLDELFSLVSMNDYSEKPPTAPLRTRIACTAAPFLILRCALTLRAYIADQPLRGKMPQPLSERKELLWVLRKLVALRCESDAIPALGGAESENRKHLLRLYPLIVKALGVGGDDDVLRLLGDALEVVGGELGL